MLQCILHLASNPHPLEIFHHNFNRFRILVLYTKYIKWLKINTSVAEFQEAFQLFDSRGDGKIHVAQIGDALRALGQNPTESDVKKFTHQHKPDERISFEVFLPIYQAISKSRTSDTADDFIEGLRHFDKDGNGFISSAELRHLLTTLGIYHSFIGIISISSIYIRFLLYIL